MQLQSFDAACDYMTHFLLEVKLKKKRKKGEQDCACDITRRVLKNSMERILNT